MSNEQTQAEIAGALREMGAGLGVQFDRTPEGDFQIIVSTLSAIAAGWVWDGPRTAEELREESRTVKHARDCIMARLNELSREIDAAMAREAEPHPWVGRKVRRRVRGPWDDDWKTQRGVMQQAPARVTYGPKGHRPRPGEPYVASASGKTRYDMKTGSRAEAWELDE